MKKIVSIVLAVSMLLCAALPCVAEENAQAVIDGIVSYFMPLTRIPRQSHHEEGVSEYLYNWAQERGFNPVRDEVNNVMFDVPATPGKENAPMTILQAHMDMVIAVAKGKKFDPQKDAITVINDGKTLRADGTTLGADDGMGVAAVLYLVDKNENHGPLRVIFTVNEEDGMGGAFAVSTDWLKGATYLINLDSEHSTQVTNSSAAAVSVHFTFSIKTAKRTKNCSLALSLTGLLSGHSGVDIEKPRLNGIKGMGSILAALEENGIDFELVALMGGTAHNAIPGYAYAIIVIDSDAEDAARKVMDEAVQRLRSDNPAETGLTFASREVELIETVLSEESKQAALRFVNEIVNGVNIMSAYVPGLVESSSNLGILTIVADEYYPSTAAALIRSSSAARLKELMDGHHELAESLGIATKDTKSAEPWPVNPDSKLVEMIRTAYRKNTGKEISVVALHAGLETGTFAVLNPDLDVVSMGFDLRDVHTIDEYCVLETIPVTYGTIADTLAAME